MDDDSSGMMAKAPSTNVHLVGDPSPADTDLAGRAIRFPLSEYPDSEWRRHFGGWDGLRDYFARIRFEKDGMLLFLVGGTSSGAIEPALDEVEQAIAKANDSRREEATQGVEKSRLLRRKQETETAQIEDALQAWTRKRTA